MPNGLGVPSIDKIALRRCYSGHGLTSKSYGVSNSVIQMMKDINMDSRLLFHTRGRIGRIRTVAPNLSWVIKLCQALPRPNKREACVGSRAEPRRFWCVSDSSSNRRPACPCISLFQIPSHTRPRDRRFAPEINIRCYLEGEASNPKQ